MELFWYDFQPKNPYNNDEESEQHYHSIAVKLKSSDETKHKNLDQTT
jgi:hypothetical protein